MPRFFGFAKLVGTYFDLSHGLIDWFWFGFLAIGQPIAAFLPD